MKMTAKILDQRQLTAAKKASREITKNKEGSNNQLEVIYKHNDTIAEWRVKKRNQMEETLGR